MGSFKLGIGALAALGSVVVYTWGSRASVTRFPGLSPLGRTAITVTSAAVISAGVAAVNAAMGGAGPDWAAFGAPEWAALGLYGIGSLAISQLLWIMAVGKLGIGMSSLHLNAVPFYVMVIQFALGHGWNWAQAFGAAVVVLGVVIAQGLLKIRR
jgi:drug/metabolite transporter (DMT)-like permease